MCKIVIVSLLLFLALLASLSLLGQELSFGLEPVPLSLDIFGSEVHVHLFLDFSLFSFKSFLVFGFSLTSLILLLLAKSLHLLSFLVGLFFLLENFILFSV